MSLAALERLKGKARPLARIGCVSIGTVYIIVGVLAVLALLGILIEAADEERMVHVLEDVPGGSIVIWSIVLGIAAYVLWRMIEVITDPYEFGDDWRGYAYRAAIAFTALTYAAIAWSVARASLGGGNGGTDASEDARQKMVAQILEWPGGAWLIGLFASIVIGVGVAQFIHIARRSYTLEINLHDLSPAGRTIIHGLAGYGLAARGAILGVIGWLLLRSALESDPHEAGDTDTAFDFIGGGPFGNTGFLLVALGTISWGLFMYANALYYQFGKQDEPAAASHSGR